MTFFRQEIVKMLRVPRAPDRPLEDKPAEIAALMRDFLARTVACASRLERSARRGPGRPGATAGSQSVLTGERLPLIDRSHCVEPKPVILTRELIIEGTHERAQPDRSEDLT